MRALSIPLLAWRALRWKAYRGGWLGRHLRGHVPLRLPAAGPLHVIVTVVDHFEPARRFGEAAAVSTVESWTRAYEQRAAPYRDADGRPPQHTWFYRSEYRNDGCLQQLAGSTFRGFGEVEFHLHHGHDDHERFRGKLSSALDWFNARGAMLTGAERPARRFAYIAGNWALDNGAGNDALSGCNTELTALREEGCYADFTFPALGSPAQPRKTNAIYYATDDPAPKSYDDGRDVEAGRAAEGDLLLVQGPLVVDWTRGRFEDGALEDTTPPAPHRLDCWLRANVHVRGRPDWVFVKLHTHGMQSRGSILGDAMESVWRAMTLSWNRPPFRLHFATARETYNMIKAAEAGHSGDPARFRDFEIPAPANRRVCCDRPWRLECMAPGRIALRLLEPGAATILFNDGPLERIEGEIASLDLRLRDGVPTSLETEGAGDLLFVARGGARHRGAPGRVDVRRLAPVADPGRAGGAGAVPK